MADLPDLGAFGASFEEFMHAMTLAAVYGESEVAVRLREHLVTDPKELPVPPTIARRTTARDQDDALHSTSLSATARHGELFVDRRGITRTLPTAELVGL